MVTAVRCCEVTRGKMNREMMKVSRCCRPYGSNSPGAMSRFWFVYDILQHNLPKEQQRAVAAVRFSLFFRGINERIPCLRSK